MVEEKQPAVGSKRLKNLKVIKNTNKKLKIQNDNEEKLSDEEILDEEIDFNMPKPGPHAKVCFMFAFISFFECYSLFNVLN